MEPIDLTKEYSLELFDLQKTVDKIDITLRDLFDIVYEAEIKQEGIAECLGMLNFMRFYEEIQQPSSEQEDPEIYYIELYWTINQKVNHKKGKLVYITDQASISPQMDVHAIGKHHGEFKCPSDCKITIITRLNFLL
jgi:hypothetical protein